MPIRPVRRLIQGPGIPEFAYKTEDGQQFFDLDEAIEHENKLNDAKQGPPVVYEQIWTIQEAINMAVAENRVVRFCSDESNKALRRGIVDIKGCKVLKRDQYSTDVAVVPPTIDGYDFCPMVDTSLSISSKKGQ